MHIVKDFLNSVIKINPIQESFLNESLDSIKDEELSVFESYLLYCQEQGIGLEYLAKSYNLIVKDTFTEQVYFKRHGHYRHASYEDVAAAVYHNKEYMTLYMYGLALSAFVWPNHREMHRFFLQQLPTHSLDKYLEIGPGHGFYFMQSMQLTNCKSYTGVDISETSVAMTKAIIESGRFGNFSNYAINHSDFLSWDGSTKYDYVVMAEVLEHVEQPSEFLSKIANLMNSDGAAFITTCINAPAIDHIFLYESVEQIVSQVEESGLRVSKQLLVPYGKLNMEQSMAQKLPVNIAMVLTHA